MEAVVENKNQVVDFLESQVQTLLSSTFSSEPDWLKAKRKLGLELFKKFGIPARKNEFYKYANLRKVLGEKYSLVHNELAENVAVPDSVTNDSIRLIFVNGWLHKDSSLAATLPKGVVLGNLATEGILKHSDQLNRFTDATNDALVGLNQASWTDGLLLIIPDGVQLEKPIELIHISTGQTPLMSCPRHLILAGKNSSASIVERYYTRDAECENLVNAYAEIHLDSGAHLDFYRLQDACLNTRVISTLQVSQNSSSKFNTINFSLNSGWIRNNLRIEVNGQNCVSTLNGLFITGGNEYVDNHTSIHHNEPNCESHQLYKGILNDRSTGVFNGRIYVKQDAQKTNAYQSSKNILLSDDASMNAKPELEIYADDVKCSHGSSTGKIDESSLFYLRSRGLSEESARRLLLVAFVGDVVNTIQIPEFKNYMEALVESKLQQ